MSKSKVELKQKKKKRKREKSSGSLPSTEDRQLDRIDVDESYAEQAKKKEKRRKKNHGKRSGDRESVDTETNSIDPSAATLTPTRQENTTTNSDKSSEKLQKKAKKKKKKKKRKSSSDPVDISKIGDANSRDKIGSHDGETTTENDAGDEIVLEGSMVSDVLVLIDRVNGKVYSATDELLENGERKQIGRLDGAGKVVLYPKPEKGRENGKVDTNINEDVGNDNSSTIFPYDVDPDDHCESPLEAYKDIIPLLDSYRRRIRKQSNDQLSIYDPYFCDGRVARQLESLGFPDVYNQKEDCYKVWKDPSKYPTYDIFLTNPPYSLDHIEKLMRHVTSKQNKNKPWMLLMPNFVHKKDYFQKFTTETGQLPIYLVPKKRYVYLPPPNMRAKKASSTHKKSSPFVSMWYLWGGSREATDEWYRVLQNQHSAAFDVARSKSALRDLRRKPKKR